MQELARSALNLLIRISRPRRGSLALFLLHAWAWLEKLFWGPEAGQQARKEKNFSGPNKFYFLSPEGSQQARKEKQLFRPQKVLFSIARGQSAGKEGKITFQVLFSIARGRSAGKERKATFQAPTSFIFYRQRPVSRQGRKNNFSGPNKFYFLSPEAGQQARKEKKLFRPQKVFYFLSPEAGQQARKEKKTFQAPKSVIFYRQRPVSRQGRKKKLFRPQKVLFSIARGRSAGKEGKNTFQAPKSVIFYRQRPVSRQGRKKKLFRPQKVLFSIARGRSAGKEGKNIFQAPTSFIFYRQMPASWVDGCRSSRIQSCSRRALHLCDNVRDVTTQAQEAQRPIRFRFKNPCKRPWIVEKNFSEAEKFFFLGVGPWKEGPQATFFLRINEVKP